MASSTTGSVTIREGIEAKRIKIEDPGVSFKSLERDSKRKRAWWNEKIHVQCLSDHGEPVQDCAWRVPRRLLTAEYLETTCLKCPLKIKIGYLQEQSTGDVVWPSDAQLQCYPLPSMYAVVPVEQREVIDRSKDPCYEGDLRVMIFNVPLKTDDGQTETMATIEQRVEATLCLILRWHRVRASQLRNHITQVSTEDVKAWISFGLAEENREVKEAEEIVRSVEKEAKAVEHQLSRVGYMKFATNTGFGKAEEEAPGDEEQARLREEEHKALALQRDKIEEDLSEARAVLRRIQAERRDVTGSHLEDVMCSKSDWLGIKLATANGDLEPWAGRGEIPDGSKAYIPRYTEYAVNMRGARIARLPHGFGQYKGVATGGVPFGGGSFSFFHGEFEEGLKSGFGVEYSEASVYCGEYRRGARSGLGALHCKNGDHIEGPFEAETRFPEAKHSVNPYKQGVPHGPVEIKFASGAMYKGEMRQGRITGKGEYVSCLGERYSGEFVEGFLHGTGSALDVVGQMWEGRWHDGEMDGEGRYSAAEVGEFEGDWVRGQWQGKGKLTWKGGNIYEGFFLDHGRVGPGILFRGNVKRVYDPRSGRTVIKSNRVYEGLWCADELRPWSTVTLTRTGDTLCLGTHEASSFNRAVNRIRQRARQANRTTTESLDFYGRYESILRERLDKKKSYIFAKQVKAANQDLIDDHHERIDAQKLKAAYKSRAINLEQRMRLNGKQLETTTSTSRAADKIEQIAVDKGTKSNRTFLSSLVQSRLEEAQELQQLVDLKPIASAAENEARSQQAALMMNK